MAMLLITHDLGIVGHGPPGRADVRRPDGRGRRAADFFPVRGIRTRSCCFGAARFRQARKPLAAIPGTVPPLTSRFRDAASSSAARGLRPCATTPPAFYPVGGGSGALPAVSEGGARVPPVHATAAAAPNDAAARGDRGNMPRATARRCATTASASRCARGLIKRVVGHFTAVDGVSFSLCRDGRWRSSASPVAARPPIGKAMLQLLRDVAEFDGKCCWTARFAGARRRGAARARREAQIIFQDPFASLNPRLRVSEILEEGPRRCAPKSTPAARRDGRGLLDRVGMRGRAGPLPARVLGRPAPTLGDRPRAGRRTATDHLRRADVGARRLGAGADPQPAARSCSASSASPISSSRTTSASSSTWRTTSQ